MIFFLLACGSSNKESEPKAQKPTIAQKSSKSANGNAKQKTLILLREADDDIAEGIANALNYHKLQPDIIYAPTSDSDFAETLKEELKRKQKIKVYKDAPPSLDSLTDGEHSIAIIYSQSPSMNGIQNLPSGISAGNYLVVQAQTSTWSGFASSVQSNPIVPLPIQKTITLEKIEEPSGLAIHPKTNHLWSVSDESGDIVDLGINVSQPTKANEKVQYSVQKYDENDLEGIAFLGPNKDTCVVVESARRLLCFDSNWAVTKEQKVEGPYNPKKDNKGPEGLSSDGLILNEGYPTAISNTGKVLNIGTDISGIEKDGTHYWILSQKDATLTQLTSAFEPIQTYNIPDPSLEGIVVHQNNIFVVSDEREVVHIITKPSQK